MNKQTNTRRVSEAELGPFAYQPLAQLPKAERPQARAFREGVGVCSTPELLQLVIGGAHAEYAARVLMGECNDLAGVANKNLSELIEAVIGIGPATATRIKACLELGRRMVTTAQPERMMIKTPADAAQLFIVQMGLLEQEEVHTLLLDSRNRVVGAPMIYRGTLSSANVRIAEIFRDAIRHNCASVIVAHNHPSTDPSPSSDDVLLTRELIKAGNLLGIEVLDHIIVGGCSRFVSLKERGGCFE